MNENTALLEQRQKLRDYLADKIYAHEARTGRAPLLIVVDYETIQELRRDIAESSNGIGVSGVSRVNTQVFFRGIPVSWEFEVWSNILSCV